MDSLYHIIQEMKTEKNILLFPSAYAIILGHSSAYAAVAQLDRVTDYESVGRGFESLLPYQQNLFCLNGQERFCCFSGGFPPESHLCLQRPASWKKPCCGVSRDIAAGLFCNCGSILIPLFLRKERPPSWHHQNACWTFCASFACRIDRLIRFFFSSTSSTSTFTSSPTRSASLGCFRYRSAISDICTRPS